MVLKRTDFLAGPKLLCLAALFLCLVNMAMADDQATLTAMLHEFMAGATRNEAAAHDRFWADDLVYTSSAGTRFGKADIMSGFEADAEQPAEAPAVTYSAEEANVRVFGDAAVITFKLLGTPHDEGVPVDEYYNTGTFLKRDGEWRAVAWQATRIPKEE